LEPDFPDINCTVTGTDSRYHLECVATRPCETWRFGIHCSCLRRCPRIASWFNVQCLITNFPTLCYCRSVFQGDTARQLQKVQVSGLQGELQTTIANGDATATTRRRRRQNRVLRQNSKYKGQWSSLSLNGLETTCKLKHANSILESFEYFCQMSSKSILMISSYTVLKLVRFRDSVIMILPC